jgi:hypothetical protein
MIAMSSRVWAISIRPRFGLRCRGGADSRGKCPGVHAVVFWPVDAHDLRELARRLNMLADELDAGENDVRGVT